MTKKETRIAQSAGVRKSLRTHTCSLLLSILSIFVFASVGLFCGVGNAADDVCVAGYSCDDSRVGDRCSVNQYSNSNTEYVCSACVGAGRAVVQRNNVNVGCAVCRSGRYASDDHTECVQCEPGYRCVSGQKYKCSGNKYLDTPGSTTCYTCSGPGYGVVRNEDGANVDCDICLDGTYAVEGICKDCPVGHWCTNGLDNGVCPVGQCATADENVCTNDGGGVACITCPDGQYGENGICYDCPVGHFCTGGQDNGLCPAGTCATADGISCTTGEGGIDCKSCSAERPYSNASRTECVICNNPAEYYENDECKSCPDDIDFNTDLYSRFRVDGEVGVSMCGIKLGGTTVCQSDSNVIWHIVNGAWHLVDDSFAVADTNSFVKNPTPNSPFGDNADWCENCESGTFNLDGEDYCSTCPAGYCMDGNSCLQCQPGYFCPGTGINNSAQSCQSTDGNGYGNLCSSSDDSCSTICPKGSFSSAGQSQCTSCAAGYTTVGAGTEFVPGIDISTLCEKIPLTLRNQDNTTISLPTSLTEIRLNRSVISVPDENN